MTRPHLIARLIFAAMGVDLLMHFLSGIGSIIITSNIKCPPESFTTKMFIIAAQLVITLIISLILLFWSDGLTKLITGQDADQYEKTDMQSIIKGFRLTMCLCGLLILYQPVSLLIPAIINGPKTIFDMALNRLEFPLPARTLVTVITQTTKGILGIYLIFGAPHYVHWQMRAIASKTRGEK
jgi:hypothetical protein